jgi:hypothetical protein
LFYLQNASFASSLNDSSGSSAILEFFQVRSVVALFARSCYARNMSAYDAAAARLVGPLFVLLFSLAWTWLLRMLQLLLLQRGAFVQVSYGGTAISAILYVFSSAATVVFTLVECTSYTDSASSVVFIDGTVACFDGRWKGLVAVVALLCLFPVALAAALLHDKLPASARAAVCRAFTERMFYWGGVTLGFRLLMSLTQFLRVDYPSLLAYVRLCLALGMLILLFYTRPYKYERTFEMDVICYVCLIAQFGLQALLESFDVFGATPSSTALLQNLYSGTSTAIGIIRLCCSMVTVRRALTLAPPQACACCFLCGRIAEEEVQYLQPCESIGWKRCCWAGSSKGARFQREGTDAKFSRHRNVQRSLRTQPSSACSPVRCRARRARKRQREAHV